MIWKERLKKLADRFETILKQEAFFKTVKVDIGIDYYHQSEGYYLNVFLRRITNGRVDNSAENHRVEFLPALVADALINCSDEEFLEACLAYYTFWGWKCRP